MRPCRDHDPRLLVRPRSRARCENASSVDLRPNETGMRMGRARKVSSMGMAKNLRFRILGSEEHRHPSRASGGHCHCCQRQATFSSRSVHPRVHHSRARQSVSSLHGRGSAQDRSEQGLRTPKEQHQHTLKAKLNATASCRFRMTWECKINALLLKNASSFEGGATFRAARAAAFFCSGDEVVLELWFCSRSRSRSREGCERGSIGSCNAALSVLA